MYHLPIPRFVAACRQSILSLLLLPMAVLATAEPVPIDIEMSLKRVSEHVYYAQGMPGMATDNKGFISNAAAILTDQGVIVVDALGSPSLGQRFLEEIRGLTDQPIKAVIVTHYHADHIYGLQVFEDLGAEIIAPGGFQDYLDAPTAEERLEERRFSLSPWVNEDTRLVRPDRVIVEQTELRLGDVTLEIRYLGPAHSDGDLAVLVRPDQVLISGDLIFEGRIPFTGSADTRRWLEALERLDNAGLQALIPGHGPAAREPAAAVSSTLDYLRYTREVMSDAVDQMTPFAEAYEAADWSRFEKLPAFAATHRRNAYGIYLSLEQEMLGD
ncbi:MAG: MBL fold metallo-hydrolase [Lamprobacter sp.]|uniref:MBL fold metallo-hydrolase n=1 Tax=Lamprobacter sp. TaxID=3100796 RepID=UPI002B258499|nr:MBL fold metallo-hydrolase [Lamprobacter sp.]MEA3640887.1 MBL fold metallo-hydrolase [Lamprobacter sp.]